MRKNKLISDFVNVSVQQNLPRVSVVSDTQIVEICGALKNIVACAAGFCDGLKCGDNTKAATIRLGLKEMMKYGEHFYPGGNPATYFESCGVADLITTCYGGRNRKVSEAFVSRCNVDCNLVAFF